ncbi:MAG TPA: hypothetical protein VGV59_11255 [Pyrinomonadaceae bacterium]|nr:hypothetical protein [Pyrinomonadaceae bacterium]
MKKLRPILLAIIIISLVATGMPIGDSLAHWSRRTHVHRRSKHKRVRHSRAWWRRRRALIRQRQERAARRRLTRRTGVAPDANSAPSASLATSVPPRPRGKARIMTASAGAQAPRAPFDLVAPTNWRGASAGAPGAMRFTLNTSDGRASGMAHIAPVMLSGAEIATVNARGKMLASIPFGALRRIVIDRMVLESGWVVNDIERTIQGRHVYVVLAQSSASGAGVQSWTFYFTEIGGRVYSLLTVVPVEMAAPVAADAEQVLGSLRPSGAATVAASSAR